MHASNIGPNTELSVGSMEPYRLTPQGDVNLDAQASDESGLWHRWSKKGDRAAREQLIHQYSPYARIVAATYYARRTHNEVEFDDYLQLASVGLVEATDRFDAELGIQFKTFAARRMHGAILNGLERLTEKNQQIAVQKKLRRERLLSLKEDARRVEDLGKTTSSIGKPSHQEVLFRYLAEVGIGLALGVLLDGTGMIEGQLDAESLQVGSPEVSYFRQTEIQHLQRLIRDSVQRLTTQEQTVIRSHYLQEVEFGEIASMMGVTKGRVSQIHRQGIVRLREILTQGQSCDVTW